MISPPRTMTTGKQETDRLKLTEAVGATALITFAAFGIAVTVAFLAARCIVVDTIDRIKTKGGNHDR